jgi:hypothetical protein
MTIQDDYTPSVKHRPYLTSTDSIRKMTQELGVPNDSPYRPTTRELESLAARVDDPRCRIAQSALRFKKGLDKVQQELRETEIIAKRAEQRIRDLALEITRLKRNLAEAQSR